MELIDIVLFAFLAFCCAALELSFQEYMKKGMILRFWSNWMFKLAHKGSWAKKLSMALGACMWCNGFWMAVIIYVLHYNDISWRILLFTGLSFLFLKLFTRNGIE